MNIVSIVVTLISIFISIVTLQEKPYISLGLLIINLLFLIILAIMMIPNGNKIRKYKNLIKNNKYYSFLYASYIDMEKPYKKRKVDELKITIKIKKEDNKINDSRKYEFKCKSKTREISLYFLNETGFIDNAELTVDNETYQRNFSGIGFDENIPEISNIINKLDIGFQYIEEKNRSNEIKCEYKRSYESNHLIYIIYPKMFSNHKKITTINVNLNEQKEKYRFKLESIGANGRKPEGVLKEEDIVGHVVPFTWEGKMKPNRVYILRGIPNNTTI